MNNNKLIPFNFDSKEIRVVTNDQGQPWFVAKDVCDVLEYANHKTALELLDQDEVGKSYLIDNLGRKQEVHIINESGLYTLIIRSNKPKAKEFRKFVTSEVLPSIRKTGSYSLTQEAPIIDITPEPEALPASTALVPVPNAPVSPTTVARDAKAWHSIAKLLGFEGNQLILSTVNAIKRQHDIDLLAALGMPQHFVAEEQVRHFAASDLAKRLGVSAVQLNKLLAQHGFQEETRDRKQRLIWQATDKGKPFAVLTDTGKQHSNGAPVQQLRWLETVLDQLPQQPMLVNG